MMAPRSKHTISSSKFNRVSLILNVVLSAFLLLTYWQNQTSQSSFPRKNTLPNIQDKSTSVLLVEETPETILKEYQIFPLLKELKCGWKFDDVPSLLQKEAHGLGLVTIDVGLNEGKEFFFAVQQGFEVIGLEPNPRTFANLARKCNNIPTCQVIQDITNVPKPLKRDSGYSYLIQAAASNASGVQELSVPVFSSMTSVGTFVRNDKSTSSKNVKHFNVTVVRLDELIDEDIYYLKTDAQGYDYYVLQGASGLFERHTVRQLTLEVDPSLSSLAGVSFSDMVTLVFDKYGMQCFSATAASGRMHGDAAVDLYQSQWKKMWESPVQNKWHSPVFEDLLCVNLRKVYRGPVVQPSNSTW